MKRIIFISIMLLFALYNVQAQNVDYVGSGLWNEVENLGINGDFAYCAYYNGLLVLDKSDATYPAFVTQLPIEGSSDIALLGNYAYLANYDSGFYVVDISNPVNPAIVGHFALSGMTTCVKIDGNYAYLQSNDTSMTFDFHIFDISSPLNITHISQTRFGGYPRSFAVSGDYAYVVSEGSGLLVLDISNRVMPESIYTFFNRGYMRGATVRDNFLYISDSRDGLIIMDITDPAAPVIVGNCETPGDALTVTLRDNYAFIGDSRSGLQIINIANPTQPTIVGSCDTPGFAYSMEIGDNLAFLADYSSIMIMGITDPGAPYIEGRYFTGGSIRKVVTKGDYAYILGISDSPWNYNLISVDISEPSRPVPVQIYTDSMSFTTDYLISDDYAYITESNQGLLIVDISNPGNMNAVSLSCSLGTVQSIAKSGNYVYLGHMGITAVDVSNPESPVLGITIDSEFEATQLYTSGNYLFSCYFLYPVSGDRDENIRYFKSGRTPISRRLLAFSLRAWRYRC